ncbi:hypothetical protein DDO73_17730 [Vibrio cholerae]|uniref:hypothetical protein n=1 Tax=Vibrio cholerae TaxID=666 RepID=UPI001A236AD5|nr:hypothetical protein [Vibrio cholerae]EGR4074896.1 hypothetical protein [Vibrio cholerae]MBY4642158.1 hypothetical protein [Vibrio cholerae]MCR9658430.1 hypothetical protein [Vibrio cholerae]MCR9689112.1 hypothetical protein [Vibrio cholerae]MCR9737619.1 hypothetical protein [Vibrio cholerae]
MDVGYEYLTDRGVATVVGTIRDYLFSVHLSPAPKKSQAFNGELSLIIARKISPTDLLGSILFSDIVYHAAENKDFVLDDNQTLFTAAECSFIDQKIWGVLQKKYQIAPDYFLKQKTTEDDYHG